MRIKSNDFILVSGKAFTGKTYWIREHIKRIPPAKLKIIDYNCNDYQDFKNMGVEVFNFYSGNQSDIDAQISEWYRKGNLFVVLEESDNYLLNPSEITSRFVNTGRNRGCGAIMNTKRAKSIKPQFRTRFNKIIAFQVTLSDDIKYLEEWAGTGRGSLEQLRSLSQGEYVIIDLDSQEISQKRKIRS
jgi:hypothetical protein